MTVEEKLQALGGIDALYDSEGAGPVRLPGMRRAADDGIFYAQAGGGRCVPLLRVLMTNVCENDCRYCSINCHRSVRRTAFRPEELARTFNAVMAGAARVTVAEVDEVVELGELDPEAIVTPGVYVQRVVVRPNEPRPWNESM